MAGARESNVPELRVLLKEFNDIPPTVKTGVRRELRHTGDDIIAAQRAILDGPLPAGVVVTRKQLVLVLNKKTGRRYVRNANVYGETAVQRPGRSRSQKDGGVGLREAIKAALATRVVTGSTRQGITITTQNSKAQMSTGWNSRRFRHPVFGNRSNFVFQAGEPYFYAPVFEGRNALIDKAIAVLNDAIEGK
jgi:hypothetical protein